MDNLPEEQSGRSGGNTFVLALFMVIAILGVALGGYGFKTAADAQKKVAALEERLASEEDPTAALSKRLDSVVVQLESVKSDVRRGDKSLLEQTQKVVNEINTILTANSEAIAKNSESLGKISERFYPALTPEQVQKQQERVQQVADQVIADNSIHSIKAGETLGSLAKRYGTTVDQLVEWNPGIDPRRLQIGQEIRIPPAQ